jgi:hypothetical protein
MSIAVMKQALELLEDLQGGCTDSDDGTVEALTIHCPEVIANLRAAIEQVEKPVAWVYPEFWDHLKQVNCGTAYRSPDDGMQPLYAAPRQWVGLNDQQVLDLADEHLYGGENYRILDFYKAIEAKLNETNA